jgi:MATE family multidrug resistance protein
MVIYGLALWVMGLGGGYWIALHATPLGPPRGAVGFWEGATVALGIAAVALASLAVAESRRHIAEH